MTHPILGRKILVITAHPDDEAFACSGTVWLNHQRGGTTALLCATLGEKGSSHLKRPMSEAALQRLRRHELKRGAAIAHFHPVVVANIADGQVHRHEQDFFLRAQAMATKFHPEVILSFGRDGISGHRDHIASGHVARRLATSLRIPLYVFTMSVASARRAPTWLKRRRANPFYRTIAPYQKPTVRIRVPRRIKFQVIQQHQSQLSQSVSANVLPGWRGRTAIVTEYFARRR